MSFNALSRVLAKRLLFHGPRRIFPGPVLRRTCSGCQEVDQRPNETHDEKNARLGRPLSPHLSIYRPQYTSMFSIVHRVTGTVFGVYIMCFAAGAVFLPNDFEYWMNWLENQHFHSAVIVSTRFVLAFPFIYHACNGVRHLLWDTAHFLGLREVLVLH
ncbi:Succinate dehydrogenase subunit C [Carabus blaptoides fortunei]